MTINLAKTEIIHFVGIGGIGMSGLALIMKGLGFNVQGSDLNLNKNIERLKKSKIKVFLGHKKKNIFNSTILVVSSAIDKNNIELIIARKKKLPIYLRGDMLAHIVSLIKKNVVVCGSHGKTTTTSLVSSIFSKAKLDPTVINGGVIKSLKNSAKLGKSNWCLIESDESDGSFLKVLPTYSIVTNIDKEHMDHYKDLNSLKKSFIEFIEKTPSFGKSVICIDDKNIQEVKKNIKVKNYLTYGTNKKSNFCIHNIKQNTKFSYFDLLIKLPGKKSLFIKKIKIPLLGLHNIRNAAASASICKIIGISSYIIKKGLADFKGVERRFNKLKTFRGSLIFDDYAHHPTEIVEVLKGVKKVYKIEEIISIFQPHRISRLKDLKIEFSRSFKNADKVILCPIYTAGEILKLGFNYSDFAKQLSSNSKVQVILINDKIELSNYIKNNIYGKKILIAMGAGSISNWIRNISEKL
ncbi:MAG: UDP-N-acetylmuramate--L-alanine ligase [Candidatus Pelagibacter sp. TMED275]|nr:MAG: UDP-N-acetylmuramate--L-alanine ligase [Candidatus Pelagibacter sp. TMED275]|tara:strand:+ start:1403 stop:2800 length:1398 start_codon:yes stop_codon:yes gene_type:complete